MHLLNVLKNAEWETRNFETARKRQIKIVDEIDMDEVKYFKTEFLPAYSLTLDEHTK